MAFPTNPADGQIYDQYTYKANMGAWSKLTHDPIGHVGPFKTRSVSWRGQDGAASTDIKVNAGNAGGTALIVVSMNGAAGDATDSGLYLIRLGYDGNHYQIHHIGGDNAWSFSLSGEILMISGAAGNQHAGIFEIT